MVLFSIISLAFGCTKSESTCVIEETIETKTKVGLTITTGDQPLYLEEAEYIIKSVRIIAFDGEVYDTYYYEGGLSISTGSHTVKMLVEELDNKTLYVILNEPARLKSILDKVETLAELEIIKYDFADYFNASGQIVDAYSYDEAGNTTTFAYTNLPMSGQMRINPSSELNYTVEVGRALARVDIWLQGADDDLSLTTESSIAYVMCKEGYLMNVTAEFPKATLSEKTLNAKSLALTATSFKRAFTLYTPERKSDGFDRLEFTITGAYSNANSAPQDFLTFSLPIAEIKRNELYTVKCTITESGKISFTYEVEDWTQKKIDVPSFE